MDLIKKFGAASAAILKKVWPPMVGKDDLCDVLGYVESAATPVGSLVPDFVGQKVFDTVNKDFFIAIGLTNADWALMGVDTLSLAELTFLDGATAGTVVASKAVVVDANKDVAQLRNLRVVRTIRGEGASFSDNTAGNISYTAAQFLGGTIVRDPNGASRTDVLPAAAAIVAALPGAAIGDILECLLVNGADAAETITLTAGAGGAYDAIQTAASRLLAQNASKKVTIRLTAVAGGSEAYVVYY